jgi:hypothetical protein
VTQDAISPNGPYVRFLKELGYHFILTVKEADHAYLFDQLDAAVEKGEAREFTIPDPKDHKKFHFFRWVNGLSINATHKDLRSMSWNTGRCKVRRSSGSAGSPISASLSKTSTES